MFSYIKIIFPVYLLKRADQGSCGVNCLIFNRLTQVKASKWRR